MKRLTLTFKGNEIISEIFNMKAWRAMFKVMTGEFTEYTLDDAALIGVIAMFDGTPITEKVLKSGWRALDENELSEALEKVYKWFEEVKPNRKLDEKSIIVGEIPDDPVLNIYHNLLRLHLLPSEVDKQEPQLLFDLYFSGNNESDQEEEIPEELKLYYGL